MSTLVTHAAWTLVIAFALSFAYELWRATARAGVSRHDGLRVMLTEGVVLYGAAAAVIAALFTGWTWGPVAGLAFSVLMILVSTLYYNPRVLPERQPGLIDWVEDLLFTGLLFVAATQLTYEVLGLSLG